MTSTDNNDNSDSRDNIMKNPTTNNNDNGDDDGWADDALDDLDLGDDDNNKNNNNDDTIMDKVEQQEEVVGQQEQLQQQEEVREEEQNTTNMNGWEEDDIVLDDDDDNIIEPEKPQEQQQQQQNSTTNEEQKRTIDSKTTVSVEATNNNNNGWEEDDILLDDELEDTKKDLPNQQHSSSNNSSKIPLLISTTEIEIPLPASGGRIIRGIQYKRTKRTSTAAAVDDDSSSCCNRWILLHGWLDNAASFDHFIPLFFQHHHHEDNSNEDLDIVALDMLGHGKSDHRNNAYHIVDYAAETLLCANHLFGSTTSFSLLGHSLGAGVALLVAGMASRQRIPRLVMVESLGPFVMDDSGSQAPSQLARSCVKIPSGSSPSMFQSPHEAAIRRATKNVVKDKHFTEEHAMVLCTRGLKEVVKQNDSENNDDKDNNEEEQEMLYTWSSDPWLLSPTRLYLSESTVRAFASSCKSETLVIMANDGILGQLGRGNVAMILKYSHLFVVVAWIVTTLLAIVKKITKSKPLDQFYKGLLYVLNGVRRIQLIQHCTTVTLSTGGHHPQLTQPELVAKEVQTWIKQTTTAKR